MDTIQGPLGFTDFDAEGMLVEGFDQLSTMATIYNYPYYPQHMEVGIRRMPIGWNIKFIFRMQFLISISVSVT